MTVRWITENDLTEPDHPLAIQTINAASWILYKLTAEKYPGIRCSTEWYGYDADNCNNCFSDLTDHVHRELLGFGSRQDNKRLRLRRTPVTKVHSVSVDGVVLDPSEYTVGNAAYLIRNGGGCWDYNRGVTVTYSYGSLPPAAGREAAITLTEELIKYASGDETCGFPMGVVSASRQGVDYAVINPQDFIADGRTGLQSVDLFIQAANPTKAVKKPRVFSVNKPRGERYR